MKHPHMNMSRVGIVEMKIHYRKKMCRNKRGSIKNNN